MVVTDQAHSFHPLAPLFTLRFKFTQKSTISIYHIHLVPFLWKYQRTRSHATQVKLWKHTRPTLPHRLISDNCLLFSISILLRWIRLTCEFVRGSILKSLKSQIYGYLQLLTDAYILAPLRSSSSTDTTGGAVTSSTVYAADTIWSWNGRVHRLPGHRLKSAIHSRKVGGSDNL